MRSFLRSFLVIAAVLAIVPAVQAQPSCYSCDPYSSSCEEPCWYCLIDYPDGYCDQFNVAYSNCGDFMGACVTCTPTWQETSRQNVGTYGSTTWHPFQFGCNHHRVDIVTESDTSECNINSNYWTRTTCDDWVDASKSGTITIIPDCCDGFCAPYVPCPQFTCNHRHECWQ